MTNYQDVRECSRTASYASPCCAGTYRMGESVWHANEPGQTMVITRIRLQQSETDDRVWYHISTDVQPGAFHDWRHLHRPGCEHLRGLWEAAS